MNPYNFNLFKGNSRIVLSLNIFPDIILVSTGLFWYFAYTANSLAMGEQTWLYRKSDLTKLLVEKQSFFKKKKKKWS